MITLKLNAQETAFLLKATGSMIPEKKRDAECAVIIFEKIQAAAKARARVIRRKN